MIDFRDELSYIEKNSTTILQKPGVQLESLLVHELVKKKYLSIKLRPIKV